MRSSSTSKHHRMATGLVLGALLTFLGTACKKPEDKDVKACAALKEQMEKFELMTGTQQRTSSERVAMVNEHMKEVGGATLSDDEPRKRYLNALKELGKAYQDVTDDEEYEKKHGEKSSTLQERRALLRIAAEALVKRRRDLLESCDAKKK